MLQAIFNKITHINHRVTKFQQKNLPYPFTAKPHDRRSLTFAAGEATRRTERLRQARRLEDREQGKEDYTFPCMNHLEKSP